jgi:hypothetical protein
MPLLPERITWMNYGYKHVAPLEQRIRNNQYDFSGNAYYIVATYAA